MLEILALCQNQDWPVIEQFKEEIREWAKIEWGPETVVEYNESNFTVKSNNLLYTMEFAR